MTNPRVLITGGAGFIGSNVVAELNARGYTNITIVDRLGAGIKWRNLIGLRFTRYMEIAAFEREVLTQPCPFDIVIHLGAASSTRTTDASYLMDNNLAFSIRLAEWATGPTIKHLPSGSYTVGRAARFIYASSAATYGLSANQSDGQHPDECRPTNPYGLSKNLFDQWAARSGLAGRIVGLKYYNVFGPNSAHKGVMVDFVAKTYQAIKADGYTTIYDTHSQAPDGNDRRDFIYVKDAVDMTLWFALDEKGKQANGLFNIGSGSPASWWEVAGRTIGAMGLIVRFPTDRVRLQSMPDDLKAQFQWSTCADIGKLRAVGYTGQIMPLADAIKDYVQTYLVPDKRRGEVDSVPPTA